MGVDRDGVDIELTTREAELLAVLLDKALVIEPNEVLRNFRNQFRTYVFGKLGIDENDAKAVGRLYDSLEAVGQ